MMKFFLIALSLTAVLAQDAEDMSIDSFLEESTDAELPCTIKPCFPVCKPQTLYISYGSFKIPYQKNVCAPLASCLNANKACQALLIKTIQQAQAQEKLVKSSYSAAKMAHANHAKKAAAAKAATEEAAKAAKAMDAAKSWSAAKTAQYGAAVREYNQAKATMDAKKTTMDAAVKQYQKTKTDHLDAVAAMHRANSAAAKALADFKAKAKAHCDSEALHARIVHSLGHAQLATKNCQKYAGSSSLKWVMEGSGSLSACRGGNCGSSSGNTNCDKICAAQGKKCDQSAINSLTSTAKIHAAFAAAGFKCKINDMGCQTRYGGGHCASWGSPYLYNQGSYLSQGRCFFGSGTGKHVHASCGQNHADGNHRRLCPCK